MYCVLCFMVSSYSLCLSTWLLSLFFCASQKLTEEKIERLHQLEEEMAGLARKIQAHEKERNAASAIPPSSKPLLSGTKDTGSQGQGISNHVTNGVSH